MIINDSVRGILNSYKGDRVTIKRMEGNAYFFEEIEGMMKLLIVADNEGMDFETSLDKTAFNLIKFNNHVEFSVNGSVVEIRGENEVVNFKISLADKIKALKGEISEIKFLDVENIIYKYYAISKGLIIANDGIYNNNDVFKCYNKIKTNCKQSIGITIRTFMEMKKMVKEGEYYENDSMLFRQMSGEGFAFQIGIRKLVVQDSNFIGFVESMECLEEFEIDSSILKRILNTVGDSERITFSKGKVLSLRGSNTYTYRVKDLDAKDISFDFPIFKTFVPKCSLRVKFKIYDNFIIVVSNSVNFLVRRLEDSGYRQED